MFCEHCGSAVSETARFCSNCGKAVIKHPQSPVGAPVESPPAVNGSASYFTPPPTPGTGSISSLDGGLLSAPACPALLDAQGRPTPAFEDLACRLFMTLDQKVEPCGTGGLEVSKIQTYHCLAGLAIPQFFAEYILPTYCRVIGIDTVPNSPSTIITWTGWHTFLLHRILANPDTAFLQLHRVLRAFNIPLHPDRVSYPATACPKAEAKQKQFEGEIGTRSTAALQRPRATVPRPTAAWGNLAGTGLPPANGAGSSSSTKSDGAKVALGVAKLGLNIANASFGGGMGGFGGGGSSLWMPGMGMGAASANIFNPALGGTGVDVDIWSNAGNAAFMLQ